MTHGKGVLLDTSVVVQHFRGELSLTEVSGGFEEFLLPQTALAELYTGAFRSAHPEKKFTQIERFVEGINVLLPDEVTAEIYGRIAAQLARAGTPIPQNDIWIAAIALQYDIPVATADGHFRNVDGLKILLW